MMSPDKNTVSPDPNGPIVVHEGALNLKGRVMFCTRWKRKYVKVRADTRQLAIYDKKVSANARGKRGECLLIQLKQVVECRPDVTSKKRNSFLIQKTPNAGANRQIIFGCVNPADRDRWVHVINDVMNGTISGQSAFDEVVVSSSALTHIVKTRPKNPGRRPPGHRARALISSPTSEISSFGDDADSGVGASSELLATHNTVHKLDGEVGDDIIEQSPTSEESAERAVSNECLVDVQVEDCPTPKSEKITTLQRLKKQKKSSGETKTAKQEKNSSFFGRLGSRISRALSRSQSTEESNEHIQKAEEDNHESRREEPDIEKEFEEIKEEETKEEVRVSQARDTFYVMPPSTKSGHDKVILELAAIAQNAKLVAAKAEALKSARLQGEGESSGEESSGNGKTLSRRDSEKNIEQAAENLRTTLKNLSEAESLEIENRDCDNPETTKGKETKPVTSVKPKMNASIINEMAGLFAKSNKAQQKRTESDDKTPDAETVDAKIAEVDGLNEKDDASNEIMDEIVNETEHNDSLESVKEEELDEKKADDEAEKEESKMDEPSEIKGEESEEEKDEPDGKKEEVELDASQVKDSKEVEPVEDNNDDDNNDNDDDDDITNENLSNDDKTLK